MASLHVSDYVLTIHGGDHISVLNFVTRKLVHLKNSTVVKIQSSTDSYLGLTRFCAAISDDGKWYAVADERNLTIWSTSNWVQKCVRVLERSASKVIFTPCNQCLLVADKTGDVYSFSLLDDSSVKGTLLLGHLSILLDMCITADEKYIITCDRDEKIRVTCYPNTYNIKSFCLGHQAFVTKIVLFSNNILLSGSGDGTLKFWQFLEAKCLSTYSVEEDMKKNNNNSKSSHCIITNLSVLTTNNSDRIICLSVHLFDGIIVYKCNSNLDLIRIQMITCDEPLDFTLNNHYLWVLRWSNQSVLQILTWKEDDCKFHVEIPSFVKSAIDIIFSECSYVMDYSHIDLSVLYNKLNINKKSIENYYKRIKAN